MTEIYAFTSKLPDTIDVKWGIADNPELGDKLKVTILASGFDLTLIEKKNGEPDHGPAEDETVVIFGNPAHDHEAKVAKDKEVDRQIAEMYGAEKLQQQIQDANRAKYAVLDPSQYDDHEVISLLERVPTFSRDPKYLDELRKSSDRKDNRPSSPSYSNSNYSTPSTTTDEEDNTNNNVISF